MTHPLARLQIGARWFGVGQKKNEIGPLKKDDIASLPQRVFVFVRARSPSRFLPHAWSLMSPVFLRSGTLPDDPSPAASDPAPASDAASPPPASAGSPSPVPVAASAHPTKPRRQLWRLWRRRRAKAPSSPGALPPTRPRRRSVPLRPCRRGLSRSDCPSRRLRARSVCAVRHPSHWTLPSSSPDSFARASAARAEYDLPPLRDSPEAASWQPERLALLPCGHAFHTECLGDWLALSGRVRAPSLSRLLSLWASSTGLLTHALMVDDRRTVPALSARPSCTEEAPHAAKRRGSAIRQRRRGEWRSRDGRARVKKQEGLRLYYCSRRCAACL